MTGPPCPPAPWPPPVAASWPSKGGSGEVAMSLGGGEAPEELPCSDGKLVVSGGDVGMVAAGGGGGTAGAAGGCGCAEGTLSVGEATPSPLGAAGAGAGAACVGAAAGGGGAGRGTAGAAWTGCSACSPCARTGTAVPSVSTP